MKKLFALLVEGCWHQWEVRHVDDILRQYPDGGTGLVGKVVEYRCSKCNKIHYKKVYF